MAEAGEEEGNEFGDEDASPLLGPRPGMSADERTALEVLQRRLFGRGEEAFQLGRYIVQRAVDEVRPQRLLLGRDCIDDRLVALEILGPPKPGDKGVAAAQHALLTEARRLVEVDHENVVTVYDAQPYGVGAFPSWAGVAPRGVYLVTEHVPGRGLDGWLNKSRRWPEIVELMRAAGRGLSALHRAGIVHGRFGPGALVIGPRERIRVRGFGLASTPPLSDGFRWRLDLSASLLPYTAPECLDGATPTRAADQFSLCVVLYELLYGDRPWAGPLHKVREAMRKGLRIPPESPVPAWIGRVLRRGTSEDPLARWPDVDALIEALDVERHRRRRNRWLMLGGAGLVLLGVAAAAMVQGERCDPVETALGEAAAGALVELDRTTKRVDAAGNLSSLTQLRPLVGFVEHGCGDRMPWPWGELDPPQLRCAEARLAALAEGWSTRPDPSDGDEANALLVAASWVDPADCIGSSLEVLPTVADLHLELAIAHGSSSPALPEGGSGWSSLRAATYDVLVRGADPRRLEAVYERALAVDDGPVAMHAALGAAWAHAERWSPDRAHAWLQHARSRVDQPNSPALHLAWVRRTAAHVQWRAGRNDAAREELSRALEAASASAWPDPVELSVLLQWAELEIESKPSAALVPVRRARDRALALGFDASAPVMVRLDVLEALAQADLETESARAVEQLDRARARALALPGGQAHPLWGRATVAAARVRGSAALDDALREDLRRLAAFDADRVEPMAEVLAIEAGLVLLAAEPDSPSALAKLRERAKVLPQAHPVAIRVAQARGDD